MVNVLELLSIAIETTAGTAATVPVGARLELRAIAQFTSNTSSDLRAASAGSTWASSDSTILVVEPTAQTLFVRGIAPGQATITAAFQGKTGSLAVTVTP